MADMQVIECTAENRPAPSRRTASLGMRQGQDQEEKHDRHPAVQQPRQRAFRAHRLGSSIRALPAAHLLVGSADLSAHLAVSVVGARFHRHRTSSARISVRGSPDSAGSLGPGVDPGLVLLWFGGGERRRGPRLA